MALSVGAESSSTSFTFNSSAPKYEYDVFLSFAGKDTRLNFTGHLYDAFLRRGVRCFRDDVDLARGENINFLFRAIQNSLCSVLVISKNYARSKWCLDELQQILESRNTLNRWVFPIFYDVDPSDVRNQRGSFKEGWDEIQDKFKDNTTQVQNWRNALSEIGNLSGWVTRGRHEADLIKNIVGVVWTYLSSKLPSHDDNLVGIDSRVAEVLPILEIELDDKRFVGIWGMGGVGKTTLARVVFERISYKFEISCFLENVKDAMPKKLVSLQQKLLSHLKEKEMEINDGLTGKQMVQNRLREKKVLLVLDDVDDERQLKDLAESPDWFGRGSRIIITTRNSQLLASCGVDEQRVYAMNILEEREALQLFLNKAFNKGHCPDEDYLNYSKSVVEYAGGLPLALVILSSFLCGRSKVQWRDALDRLKQIPNKEILQVLKISYDELNEEEKTIFLDIACFFKGLQKKKVTQILEGCDLHATIGIKILIEKTLLIETDDNRLEMHDLLEELGKYIVQQESPTNCSKRSRLWKFEDVKKVLENNLGSEAIEAIVIWYDFREEIEVHPEAFSTMSNIRLLFIDDFLSLSSPGGMKLSAGALKYVEWPSYPFNTFPLETPLTELVHIEMRDSQIKQLVGVQFMRKLKFLDLSYSWNFTEIPDLSGVPCLEHLILKGCTSLVKVHPSLGKLKKLAHVCLNFCCKLEFLPRKLENNSLIKLELCQCVKLTALPEFEECMKRLSYLDVSGTDITTLPQSFGFLTGLKDLKLGFGKILNLDKLKMTHICRQIFGLNVTSLTQLYLPWCGLNDGSVLDAFGFLSSLIVLDLSGNEFAELSAGCFSSCFQLLFLSLYYCEKLKSLPKFPPRLLRLNACGCKSMGSLSSDKELWNLVATLDHEYRGRTNKYTITVNDYEDEDEVELEAQEEWFPLLRDFCAFIPGGEIPSWFSNRKYNPLNDKVFERNYQIKVSISENLCDREWSGIAVCCLLSPSSNNLIITWSSKSTEDDRYIGKGWGHGLYTIKNDTYMCIMVLQLNEETCWQHIRGHHNSLHIKFSVDEGNMKGCGWRVICKEEIKEWCDHNNGFNQLIQPQLLASPHSTVHLPSEVRTFFRPLL